MHLQRAPISPLSLSGNIERNAVFRGQRDRSSEYSRRFLFPDRCNSSRERFGKRHGFGIERMPNDGGGTIGSVGGEYWNSEISRALICYRPLGNVARARARARAALR